MEEEDWQQQTTFEDVLQAVMNSKSVGRLARNSRLGQRSRQALPLTLSGSKLRADGDARPVFKAKFTHADPRHSTPPPSPPLHLPARLSTSKLRKTHSKSTPELHSKFSGAGTCGVKPAAAREVDFRPPPLEKENALHSASSTSLSRLRTISTSSTSLRQPLRELDTPWRPPQHPKVEVVTTDLPSPTPVPPRQRRRGLFTQGHATATPTTATTTSPPTTTTATTTPSPDQPIASLGLQRGTPLVRTRLTPQQGNSRSNTSSEVGAVLARAHRLCAATESHTDTHRAGTDTHSLPRVTDVHRTGIQTHTNTGTHRAGTHTHTNPATYTDAHRAGTHTHTNPATHTGTHKAGTHTHTNTATHTDAHSLPQTTNAHKTTTDTPRHTQTSPADTEEKNNKGGEKQGQEQAPLKAPAPPATPSDVLTVNGKIYLKLQLLGRGGSSKVYEVLDRDGRQIRALKVVSLDNLDTDTHTSYKNEIAILQRLKDCKHVIHLYDHEVTPDTLVLVMERGSLDFTGILNEARAKKGRPIPLFTIKHYWAGMLRAVQEIHQHGIIHSDLKPANFLLVDSTVKLIDFGIASTIQHDMTSVIKDSQAGTFNYMSPESLEDIHTGPIINRAAGKPTIKIGVKSDVWSLGCILYNLVYGRTPFQHITNLLVKLAAISNHATKIEFPEIKNKDLMDVMRVCLQYDPRKRPSIEELLAHPLLTS